MCRLLALLTVTATGCLDTMKPQYSAQDTVEDIGFSQNTFFGRVCCLPQARALHALLRIILWLTLVGVYVGMTGQQYRSINENEYTHEYGCVWPWQFQA